MKELNQNVEPDAQPTYPDYAFVRSERYRMRDTNGLYAEEIVRERLLDLAGISGMDFDAEERTVTVRYSLGQSRTVGALLKELGFVPDPMNEMKSCTHETYRMETREKLLLTIAGLTALLSELASISSGFTQWEILILSLCSIAAAGRPILRRGWIAFRASTVNIYLLMSLVIVGAMLIGRWSEAAMVAFFFAAAEAIEVLSVSKIYRVIATVTHIGSGTAELKEAGTWRRCAATEIYVGAFIRLRMGARVPSDCRVTQGRVAVNESAITGEGLPVKKGVGDLLYAGSLVVEGVGEALVTALAKESTVARAGEAVRNALTLHAPVERLMDRFARYYTPLLSIVAILITLTGLWVGSGGVKLWIYRGLLFLVISCPCSLIVSTPICIAFGLTAAGRRGILVKGGAYLESGRKLQAIVMDERTTLAHEAAKVTEVVPIGQRARHNALQLAASLCISSEHAESQALVSYFHERQPGVEVLPVSDFHILAGRGVEGTIHGVLWRLGNHRLMEDLAVSSPGLESIIDDLERGGKVAESLCGPGGPVAIFGISASPRAEATAAVHELHTLGVTPVLLSSGGWKSAISIGDRLGIEEIRAELDTSDKALTISALRAQYGMVGLISDGNQETSDPSHTDIRVAIGISGTAIGLDHANVAIIDDDLRKLPEFIRLSRKTFRILQQNIFLSLTIKLVVMLVAFDQQATLGIAVLSDLGVTLLVIGNGLRILQGIPAIRGEHKTDSHYCDVA